MDDRSDPQREEVHLGVIDVEEHLHVTARDQLVKERIPGRSSLPGGPLQNGSPSRSESPCRRWSAPGSYGAPRAARTRYGVGTGPDRVGEEYDDLTRNCGPAIPRRHQDGPARPRKQSGPPRSFPPTVRTLRFTVAEPGITQNSPSVSSLPGVKDLVAHVISPTPEPPGGPFRRGRANWLTEASDIVSTR